MIELLKAFLFGIVEGITEWLPISSTGHMILLNEFVKLDVSEAFYSMFEVVIQLGAILAVVVLFWGQIFPFERRKGRHGGASIVLNILVENAHKGKPARINALTELTYPTVFMIGMFQLIAAVFPGTSRSGATIVGALLLGVSRTVAAEFTFFLAIPVMFGASLLKILKFGFAFTSTELMILGIGTITAFVSSLLIIRFLMSFVKKHDFKVFGWYRIILGIAVLAYFMLAK